MSLDACDRALPSKLRDVHEVQRASRSTDLTNLLRRCDHTGFVIGRHDGNHGDCVVNKVLELAEIKTVQARLRHASASTTLDIYGHLWPDADESTRTAIGAVIAARIAQTSPPTLGGKRKRNT